MVWDSAGFYNSGRDYKNMGQRMQRGIIPK
jgi:hypothetical protein